MSFDCRHAMSKEAGEAIKRSLPKDVKEELPAKKSRKNKTPTCLKNKIRPRGVHDVDDYKCEHCDYGAKSLEKFKRHKIGRAS